MCATGQRKTGKPRHLVSDVTQQAVISRGTPRSAWPDALLGAIGGSERALTAGVSGSDRSMPPLSAVSGCVSTAQ
jgi:hypothetical protein